MGGHLYIAELKIQQSVHLLCCNFGQQICQQAIKAASGGQQRRRPDSSFSGHSLAGQERSGRNDRGGIAFFFERAAYVFEGNFIQGSDVQPKFAKGRGARVGKTGEGAAGVSALASTWSCTASIFC